MKADALLPFPRLVSPLTWLYEKMLRVYELEVLSQRRLPRNTQDSYTLYTKMSP